MAAFSTLLIGPDGRGRDFRIRAEARAAEAETPPGTMARNLPLMLARWAETGEPDVVACLPLPGGDRMVLRARNHGRTDSGFACFANAVVVPATTGVYQERVCLAVLALIPDPDGSDSFARSPLTVDSLSDPVAPAHDWTGLEPRWHRRIVVTDGTSPEPVLISIVRGLAEEAHAPLLNWATSVHWAAVIGEPALIVVPPGREDGISGFEPARMTAEGFDGPFHDAPVSIRMRDRFLGLLTPEVRTAASPRITGDATAVEDDIMSAARDAIAKMSYDNGLSQILRLAAVPPKEFDGFFTDLARRLFAGFVQSDAHKGQLRRTLDIFEAPENRSLVSALGPAAAYVLDSPDLCRGLDLAMVARLTERHDLKTVLASRADLPRILRDVRPEVLTALYEGLLSRDLTTHVAQALTAAARERFPRMDVSGIAALLNRQLRAEASLAKTHLLIDLVLLIYQTDAPASTRHG